MPRVKKGAAKVADAEENNKDFLQLSIDQLLDNEFVQKKTRTVSSKGSEGAQAAVDDDDGSEITPSTLVASVLKESRVEHLTAGFTENVREADHTLARLSRELAAQAYSVDSFKTLTQKRNEVLRMIHRAYEEEVQAKQGTSLNKKAYREQKDPLVKAAITSGINVMLLTLEDSAKNNPPLATRILRELLGQLEALGAGEFVGEDPTLPPQDLSAKSFSLVRDALFRIASNTSCETVVRARCVEVLLGVAVACASLPAFLSVLRLLLLNQREGDPLADVPLGVGHLLYKLRALSRGGPVEEPSAENLDMSVSVPELGNAKRSSGSSITSDGSYLYVLQETGLYKLGTGINETRPGTIYAEIENFRAKTRATIACAGDKLYYRAFNNPHHLSVLSTKYLMEETVLRLKGASEDGSDKPVVEETTTASSSSSEQKAEANPEDRVSQLRQRLEEIESRINNGTDDESLYDEQDMIYRQLAELESGGSVGDYEEDYDSSEEDAPRPVRAAVSSSSLGSKLKGPLIPMAPVISDGRFVYLVNPELATPAAEETTAAVGPAASAASAEQQELEKKLSATYNLRVDVADPREAGSFTEPIHSITLKRAPPKGRYFLSVPRSAGAADATATAKVRRKALTLESGRPCAALCTSKQLEPTSSFTFELFIRAQDAATMQNTTLFCLGLLPGRKDITFNFQNNMIVCQMTYWSAYIQSSTVTMLPLGEWVHFALTFDADSKRATVYQAGVQKGTYCDPTRVLNPSIIPATSRWFIGSTETTVFAGDMADVRMWKRCLSASEIAAIASGSEPGNMDGMVAHYPCNDGAGVTLRDIGPNKLDGFLNEGWTWSRGDGPIAGRVLPQEHSPYNFSGREILQHELSMWTNGEHLCMISPMPYQFGAPMLPAGDVKRDLLRVFNLTTGEVEMEQGHSFCADHPAFCYYADQQDTLLYAQSSKMNVIQRFRVQPPNQKSAWRAARIKGDSKEGDGVTSFPSVLDLLAKYPLRFESAFNDAVEKREELKLDPSLILVDAPTTAMHVLARLDEDCSAMRHVGKTVPAGLNFRLSVDVDQTTFESLLELVQSLIKDYYLPDDPAKAGTRILRIQALFICLRLLRINVQHLAGWNVDPKNCGFVSDKDSKAPTFSSIDQLLEALMNAGTASSGSMQRQFVETLNRIIVEQPTGTMARLLTKQVSEEVCETLSAGMALFYGVAPDRVKILNDLLTEMLAFGPRANPLRSLLMSRYFASQREPQNVVSLAEALVKMQSSDPEAAALLDRVAEMVLSAARTKLDAHFKVQAAPTPAAAAGADADSAPAPASALKDSMSGELRDFVARVFVTVLQAMRKSIQAASQQASSDKKKGQDKSSSASKQATEADPALLRYVGHLSNKIMRLCIPLLQDVTRRIAEHQANPASPLDLMALSETLRTSTGSLLRPILTSLNSLHLTTEQASQFLPPLFALLRSIDQLASKMPDVIGAEAQFLRGRMERVMVTQTATVDSEHPLTATGALIEKCLSIPGATFMTLEISPQTTLNSANGNLLSLYRGKGQQDPIPGGVFTAHGANTSSIRVPGDTVWVCYNPGYSSGIWGFSVTGRANLEEDVLTLPWLMDLGKATGLLSANCVGVILRGEDETAAERDLHKWLSNELLSEGLDFGTDVENAEKSSLSWLPSLQDEMEDALPSGPPSLERQLSYVGEPLEELAIELAERMTKAGVKPQAFPIPPACRPVVDKAVLVVLAVVLKHNNLITETKEWLRGDPTAVPSAALVRAWKAPHRLRQWLMQRYQERNAAEMKKIEAEEKKKKEAAEKKAAEVAVAAAAGGAAAAAAAAGTPAAAADGPSAGAGDTPLAVPDKVKIYSELCAEAMARARFLLNIVPVPNMNKELPSANPAALTRQKSATAAAAAAGDAPMSDDQKKARETLAAWQSTKESVQLKYASAEDRFALLWKLVLNFLSGDCPLEQLQDSMVARRRRARLRAHGFRLFTILLSHASLSSIKREIISALVPALSWSPREAASGIAPEIGFRLNACGYKLQRELYAAVEEFFRILIGLLNTPERTGSPLLQAILHTFSIKYSPEEFQMVLSLGIFPALHRILLSDVSGNASLTTLGLGLVEKKERKDAKEGKETKGEDPEDRKEEKSGKASKQKDAEQLAPYHTSAWSLLDLLTTLLLKSGDGSAAADSAASSSLAASLSDREPVFEILLSSLEKTEGRLLSTLTIEDKYIPKLPVSESLDLTGTDSKKKPSAAMTKLGAVTTFGMATSSSSSGDETLDSSADREREVFGDSFTIRVLHLVSNMARLRQGRTKLSSKQALRCLFSIFSAGSPRAQVIVLRILRRLLCPDAQLPEESLSLALADSCISGSPVFSLSVDQKSEGARDVGVATVRGLLAMVGQGLLAPAVAYLAHQSELSQQPAVRNFIQNLRLSRLASADGLSPWGELVSLLRYVAKNGSSEWVQAIDSEVARGLKALPRALQLCADRRDKWISEEGDVVLSAWQTCWHAVGALCIFGGWNDAMPRVGTDVFSPQQGQILGTIVSRNFAKGKLTILQHAEGTVCEENTAGVIAVGEVPFDPTAFKTVAIEDFVAQAAQLLDVLAATENAASEAEAKKTKKKKKSEEDESAAAENAPTLTTVVRETLQTRLVRAVNSLLLCNPQAALAAVRRHRSVLSALLSLASKSMPIPTVTAAIEDAHEAILVELTRRARPRAVLSLTLRNDSVSCSAPHFDTDTQATFLGVPSTDVAAGNSVTAPLTYIKLDEEPTAEKVTRKIVLVDTYGNLAERLTKIAALQPSAILLGLIGSAANTESLHETAPADREKKDAKKGSAATDVLAEARRLALQAARTTNPEAVMAMGGFGGGAPRPGGLRISATGVPLPDEDPMGAAAGRAAGGSTAQNAALFAKDFIESLSKLRVRAVPQKLASMLRNLLGVDLADEPSGLYRKQLAQELEASGFAPSIVNRALNKVGLDLAKAKAWIEENKDWLMEQLGDGQDEDDEDDEFGSAHSSSSTSAATAAAAAPSSIPAALSVFAFQPAPHTLATSGGFAFGAGAFGAGMAPAPIAFGAPGAGFGAMGDLAWSDQHCAVLSQTMQSMSLQSMAMGAMPPALAAGAGPAAAAAAEGKGDEKKAGAEKKDKKKEEEDNSEAGKMKKLMAEKMKQAGGAAAEEEQAGGDEKEGKDGKKDKKKKGDKDSKKDDKEKAAAAGMALLASASLSTAASSSSAAAAADADEKDPEQVLLETELQRLSKETPDLEAMQLISRMSRRPRVMPQMAVADWEQAPVPQLLERLYAQQRSMLVQYCRRALVAAFVAWPVAEPLIEESVGFGSGRAVAQTLRLGMLLDDLPTAEPQPATRATEGMFRARLLDSLARRLKGSVDDTLRRLLLEDSYKLLSDALGPAQVVKKPVTKSGRTQTVTAPASMYYNPHGAGYPQAQPATRQATKLDTGFPAMTLVFEANGPSVGMGTQFQIILSEDSAGSRLIRQLDLTGRGAPVEAVVFTGSVFITVSSSAWYQGSRGIEVQVTAREREVSEGDSGDGSGSAISTAVTLLDVCIRNRLELEMKLLVMLLRSLMHAPTVALFQSAARTAIRLFNNWSLLRSEDPSEIEAAVAEIKLRLSHLAGAHASLRAQSLLNWSAAQSPGPLLQNLMELVLAAKKALGEEADGFKTIQLPESDKWLLDYHRRFRDGPVKSSFFHVGDAAYVPGITPRRSLQGYACDCFIADTCLKGGAWYYEIKVTSIMNSPSVFIGFVTRHFNPAGNTHIGNDMQGQSWSVCFPNASMLHRRSNQMWNKSGVPMPMMTPGMVIGVTLDLEAREIRYTFNGKDELVQSGVMAEEGLYPALSLMYNLTADVNFGAQPFAYPPPAGSKIAPIADLRFAQASASSSFARYSEASELTYLLFQRSPIPQNVIDQALAKEVSLDSANDIRFQVTKGEHFTAPHQGIIQQEGSASQPGRGGGAFAQPFGAVPFGSPTGGPVFSVPAVDTNYHMTFNVEGKDADVILQEVYMHATMAQGGSFRGMVFVSNAEPDLDSFHWCSDWDIDQYKRFAEKKRSPTEAWRPHQPVAFFTTTTGAVRCKLEPARRCRYVTIKLIIDRARVPVLDQIKFTCVHGQHPLGPLVGSPQLETAVQQNKQVLLEAATFAKPWTLAMDEALVALAQKYCSKLGVSPLTLDAIMLDPSPELLVRFKALQGVDLPALRARYSVLKYLNRLVTPLLHYVDIRLVADNPVAQALRSSKDKDGKSDEKESLKDLRALVMDQGLSQVAIELKGLYFMSTKKSIFDTLLAQGRKPGQPATSTIRLNINRITSAHRNPAKDPFSMKSQFGQLFTQLRSTRFESLRGDRNQQMFSVVFVGEGSIDAGGPYRDLLSGVCGELMSDVTTLFIPSPNRKNGVGLNREKFVINPSANSSLELSMFEVVGALMGMALRTSFSLNLDLPSYIWKQLLDEPADEIDLEGVDKLCVQAFGEMKKFSRAQFDQFVQQKFTTQLSNGKEQELKKGGKDVDLTYDNRDEFFNLSIQARLHEADKQIRAMKKGLNTVVPANLLTLFSWYDLELLICGNPEIDLKLLKKHTVYNSVNPNSPLIKFFWDVLESFNTDERQMFLRFVWGRSRLPVSESDWSQQFTINPLSAGDDHLPVSHTCFFSIDLPNYSSYDVLREKLVYAIFNCTAIDIDFSASSSSLNAWVDVE